MTVPLARIRPRAIGALLLLFGLAGAMPQTTLARDAGISLAEAVRLAVDSAPRLQARRAQVEAASLDARREGALPEPMLMLGLDNLPVTGADAFDTSADDMTMKRVGLRQAFPARAKREAQRALASRRTDAARALERSEQLDVKQAVADAWIDVWAADRERAALSTLRDQAVLAARLAKARAAGGAGSLGEALAAQASVLEVDAEVEAARARAQVAGAELRRWLDRDVGQVAAAPPDFGSLPASESELLAGLDRSGRLLSATAQLETAAAEIDAARAQRRPDWSVEASYGQRSGDRSDMLMLEVGIGLPALRRASQDGGIAAREADYRAALATREDLRREQDARIRAGLARWQGLRRQVALHEDALLRLARDRSAAALAAYRAGGPLAPWLEARRSELETHRSHARHRAELGRAWAALAYVLPMPESQP